LTHPSIIDGTSATNIYLKIMTEDGENYHESNAVYDAHPVKSAMRKDPHHDSSLTSAAAPEVDLVNRSDNATIASVDEEYLRKKKALTWDEHAIEEHDLLRGTRMKIDEPNTPYSYYDHHSDEDSAKTPPPREDGEDSNNPNNLAMNWDRLETKLGAVAAARDLYPSSPSGSSVGGADSDGGTAESKRALRKETEFKMLRKQHYNEMEAVNAWRNKHDDDDDDDDSDDMEI